MANKVKIKDLRRDNIINASLKVFCEKGYESTTIDDIVKKIGCSHGLFYHYFKNKTELFKVVLEINAIKTKEAIFNKINDLQTYTDKLKTIIDSLFYDIKNDANYGYFFYLFIAHTFSENTNKIFNAPSIEELFERFFEKGQINGEFTTTYSAKELSLLFISIIKGSTFAYILAPKSAKKSTNFPSTNLIVNIFLKETN